MELTYTKCGDYLIPDLVLLDTKEYHIGKYGRLCRAYLKDCLLYTSRCVYETDDELLSAVGQLAAEYGKIGGNLNQIARYLNEYGVPYNALSGEVRAAIADLAALKYEVLKKVGDAVGNTQAYQL